MSSVDAKAPPTSGKPSFGEIEAETLALLRKYGVSERAIRNFEEPWTVVEDPHPWERMEALTPEPRPAIISDLRGEPGPRPDFDSLWVLASEDGLRERRAFPFDQQCLIGRGSGCHIQIRRDAVSRTHALLERAGDRIMLLDMNSTNGLLLNGSRLAGSAGVGNGDRIQISRTVFEVILD